MWFPDILSPQSHLEIILGNWSDGVRGEKPTDEEWEAFFAWLSGENACALEDPRPFQMFIHLFDRKLTNPDGSPGKMVRLEDEESRVRTLERLIRDLDATYEREGKEWSILDLWLEEKCLSRALLLSDQMRRNWKDLRLVLVDADLSEETYEYLEEATMSYLVGQYRACVALCRSALELVLKESLGFPPGSEHTLLEMVRTAKSKGLLVGKHHRFATKVRKEANAVIHPRKEVGRDAAQEVLKLTGYVVEALSGS